MLCEHLSHQKQYARIVGSKKVMGIYKTQLKSISVTWQVV